MMITESFITQPSCTANPSLHNVGGVDMALNLGIHNCAIDVVSRRSRSVTSSKISPSICPAHERIQNIVS